MSQSCNVFSTLAPRIACTELPLVKSSVPSLTGLLTPPWTPSPSPFLRAVFLPTLFQKSLLLTSISFDVSRSPRSGRYMLQPATNPPIPSLTITSLNLKIPLQVPIHATLAPHVTILDLYRGLNDELSEPLSQTELNRIDTEAVWATCYRRKRDAKSSRADLSTGVPRRIDSLLSYNVARFGSLSKGRDGLILAVNFERC